MGFGNPAYCWCMHGCTRHALIYPKLVRACERHGGRNVARIEKHTEPTGNPAWRATAKRKAPTTPAARHGDS